MQLFLMSMSLWLVVCLVLMLLGLCLSKNCVDVIDVNGFTGECTNKWKNLKPILKRKNFYIFPFYANPSPSSSNSHSTSGGIFLD